ncbi:MAG: hypothetical protein ACPGVI_06105 [Crocinitomicaceae bacterium]
MPNYIVSKIDSFDLEKANASRLLWVLHADKIPPHIGVSIDGDFYSLKANGKDEGVSINGLLEIVNRRKIATLCFELNSELSQSSLVAEFDKFEKTIPNEITCLRPIKNVLMKEHAAKLIELLHMLDEDGQIGAVMGININADFHGIQDYNVDAIHARLKQLDK